ncbi:hypothetical protein CAEBREN_18646 [Caenorhabditis brenneri]|uniref:Chromo domain-containing protein n=1 Tax=Caenorhabditis brenneri TaxID=135651 RepID=G0MG37_CAEBE|nr:hypothetical protein CAEBREN_18646 [Caenorhabditis brenneri]
MSNQAETAIISDNETYEVEKIIGRKFENGTVYYQIKWKGWSKDAATWEPSKNLNCNGLIKKFELEIKGTWTVEKILDKQMINGRAMYQIKWQDWSHEDNTWEPKENILCKDLLEEFEKNWKKKPETKRSQPMRKPAQGKKSSTKRARAVSSDSEDDDSYRPQSTSQPIQRPQPSTGRLNLDPPPEKKVEKIHLISELQFVFKNDLKKLEGADLKKMGAPCEFKGERWYLCELRDGMFYYISWATILEKYPLKAVMYYRDRLNDQEE